jgi:hypothetical protein
VKNVIQGFWVITVWVCLAHKGMAASPDTSVAGTSGAPMSAQRRAIMTDRLHEFDSLTEEEQQRIRTLHQSLQQPTPDGKKLQSLLNRYDRWLATLSPAERERIEAAKTADERIAVVKELVNEQATALERELTPVRPPEEIAASRIPPPGPGGPEGGSPKRPDGQRQRSNFFEEQRQLMERLKTHLTPFESQQLEEMRGRHRLPLMLALLLKYDLPLPNFFQENELPMSPLFTSLVENPEAVFGAKLPQLMSKEAKQQFGAFMADVLLLPDLDEKKRFAFLQQQPEKIRDAVEEISNLNQYVAKSIVNTLYFAEHPEEAPEETRDSLKLINVRAAIQFIENPIVREVIRPSGPVSFWGSPNGGRSRRGDTNAPAGGSSSGSPPADRREGRPAGPPRDR